MAEQLPFTAGTTLGEDPEPRCPCVLLLDTSGSMNEIVADAGKWTGQTVHQDGRTYDVVSGGVTRMDQLNEGLRAFHADLQNDRMALRRVEVAIITFGGAVETVQPFVSAGQFLPTNLSAGGETPMGAAILEALRLVEERKQAYKASAVQFFRPWVFLITDGEPTDGETWRTAAAKVHEGEQKQKFAFFSVGVEGADFGVLRQLSAARQPMKLNGCSFREMFKWLSGTLRSVSQSSPGQEGLVKFAPTGWASL